MKYTPSKYISRDLIFQILILRAVGFLENTQCYLLRLKNVELRYIIEHYRHYAYNVYMREYMIIDYLNMLSNSIYIPRESIKEVIYVSFMYNCSSYMTLAQLQDYIASLPIQYRPRFIQHVPLFHNDSFHILWYGMLPVIRL